MTFRLILSVAVLMTTGGATAGLPDTPARLEGMNYDEAKSIIIGFGWKPFVTECGGPPVDHATCARYPELGYCQGVERGFCGMTFTKADRCLHVTTVESPPGQGGYTVVYRVHFSRGACPRFAS